MSCRRKNYAVLLYSFSSQKVGGYSEEDYDLTICLVTYHPDWKKMRRSLLSILRQQHIRLEIIVSDDGSEDDYFDRAEALFEKHGFRDYKFVKIEKNQGTVNNVYTAYRRAKGLFIRGLTPGDYLVSETELSEWLDRMLRDECPIAFGDSVYYSGQDDGIKIHRIPAAPRSLYPYRIKHSNAMRTAYLPLGNLICAASFIMFYGELALDYLEEIHGRVIYAEDNIYRLMMFDGITFPYFSCNNVFYEYGTGVSTSGSAHFRKLLAKDMNAANEIMTHREPPDRLAEKYQKYLLLQRRSLALSRIYKYLAFPWALVLRVTGVIKPEVTRCATDKEQEFYRNL